MDTMFAGALYVAVQNALLGEDQKPVTMPWPWDVEEQAPEVSADELAALKHTLNAHSAFGQVRPQ
ncbi:hypothetical protein [Arthrobacter sp. SDTb3-6]|uniref:hypothetical protein n=1 Tax=Arthrobacter sp. SDTb3-6 TaxID=2713571 RepID=UPI00159DE2CE|nr:hypothetical protein [Arthrobacter sp. SDTb3-6]NVM97830.1 hypothetical protein [Arthrobacter sp. SDTb3-6]